jgi:hypothetical protein
LRTLISKFLSVAAGRIGGCAVRNQDRFGGWVNSGLRRRMDSRQTVVAAYWHAGDTVLATFNT